MDKSLIFEIFFCLLIAISFLFDAFSLYVKTEKTEKRGEYLAYANLIQYIARLLNMLSVFLMAIIYENSEVKLNLVAILCMSGFFGVVLLVIGLHYRWPYKFAVILMYPITYLSFNKIKDNVCWKTIEYKRISFKVFCSSVATYLLIIFGMFAPFFIAEVFPNMRMTSVYVGQILNFAATITVLAYQEPAMMRILDLNGNEIIRATMVYSRIFTYIMLIIFSVGAWYVEFL